MSNRKHIYFSSDLHIGHANVIKYSNRPFRDVDHMYRVLVNNFNSTISKNGVCYFLGDMGFNNQMLRKFLSELHMTKILVVGNHDSGYNSLYGAGFDAVMHGAVMQIAGERVTMSHCPLLGVYREDTTNMRGSTPGENWHKETKNAKYSFTNEGQFHLSGHLHSGPNNQNGTKAIEGRQYDIGIDGNNYYPVSISKIESWITKTKEKEKGIK